MVLQLCQAQCVADVVFLNGTVGAGKTTVADALSDLERRYRRPHAVIDLDQLRRLWPSTESDPFHLELELEYLAVVAANYRRFGIGSSTFTRG